LNFAPKLGKLASAMQVTTTALGKLVCKGVITSWPKLTLHTYAAWGKTIEALGCDNFFPHYNFHNCK
jgi:hypothetical protein